jgi:hypothetical protein
MASSRLEAQDRCLRLRDEQRKRWAAGDRVLIETMLLEHPDLASESDLLLDLVYGEVCLQEEFGVRPLLADYMQRFPQLGDELERLFAVHDAIGEAETGTKTAREMQSLPRGLPIPSPPISRMERCWTWCQREPAIATLIVAVVLLLTLGTVVSGILAITKQPRRTPTLQCLCRKPLNRRPFSTSDRYTLSNSPSKPLESHNNTT